MGRIADAVWFAGIILLGVLLWLFYPARVEAATIPRRETWTRGFLTGLAGLVLGPVLIVLAFVTVVGSPVALALLGVYLVAMLFTIPLAGPLAARQVLAAYFPETRLHPVAVAAPMRACSEEEERFVSLSEDCFMDEKHEGHYADLTH